MIGAALGLGDGGAVAQTPQSSRNDTAAAHRAAAEAALSAGDTAEARRQLEAALAIANSAKDHLALGRIHAQQSRYALAAEQFERAIELGSDTAPAHLALADAYHQLKKDVGNRRLVERPDVSTGLTSGGVYLLRQLDVGRESFVAAPRDSAIYQIQRAIDLGARDGQTLMLRATILLDARCYDLAVAAFRYVEARIEQLELTPDEQGELYRGLGEALYGADDIEGFIESMRKAEQKKGSGSNCRNGPLGSSHKSNPTPFSPLMANAYRRAAERYCQRGDVRAYIHNLELAIAEAPNAADLRYDLGIAYWEAGDKRNAIRQWRMTLELDPNHPQRARMLQWIASGT
jgi:tetratricopeptide (TPR) repeat protein